MISLPALRALTDSEVATIAPPLVFWVDSLIFHAFDEFKLFQRYKLIPEEEAQRRNIATKYEVVTSVLMQHAIQMSLGLLALRWEPMEPPLDDPLGLTAWFMKWLINDNPAARESPIISGFLYFAILLARQVAAFIVYDTWQFWVHRFGHVNSWAYRKWQSFIHKNIFPPTVLQS
jgi:sphinganine C4-monooxygenase